MIFINRQLERLGKKMFRVLPQRKSFVPKYITLETKSIVDILASDATTRRAEGTMGDEILGTTETSKSKVRNNPAQYQVAVWNYCTSNLPKPPTKSYTFSYCIMTDGVTASVRYISAKHKVVNDQKKERMKAGRQQDPETKAQNRVNKKEEKLQQKKRKAEAEVEHAQQVTKKRQTDEKKKEEKEKAAAEKKLETKRYQQYKKQLKKDDPEAFEALLVKEKAEKEEKEKKRKEAQANKKKSSGKKSATKVQDAKDFPYIEEVDHTWLLQDRYNDPGN